jgi:starch-binding outer membrane protein, SusD/RagB family
MRRRIAYLTLVGTLAATAVACNDNKFLKEQPHDFVGPANFYRNTGDALAAVNAVYASFINSTGDGYYGRNFPMLVEFPTEAVTSGRLGGTNERSMPDNYTLTPSHAYIATVWTSAYQAINRANAVLDNVPQIEMVDSVKQRILGEAKFLRALHYFNLVRMWGGVPLRIHETSADTPLHSDRASAGAVYDQIVKDLTEAATQLPASYPATDRGRATRGAAKTLLGKVYLQRGATGVGTVADFASAETVLRDVQATGGYSLVPNFATMFDVYGGTLQENNSEVIFDIQNVRAAGLGGRMSSHMAPNGTNPYLGASTNGSVAAELNFFNSYALTDTRRNGTWLLSWVKNGVTNTYVVNGTNAQNTNYGSQTPFPRKYLDHLMPSTGAEEPNYILLRYADVLLMLAEAINEQSGPTAEAVDLVNQVRRRANVTNNLTTALSRQQFKDSLSLERRKELVLEGHGHFDSVRNWDWAKARIEANLALGRVSGAGNRYPRPNPASPTVLTDKYKLFPIPQAVIDLNPGIGQNPGW